MRFLALFLLVSTAAALDISVDKAWIRPVHKLAPATAAYAAITNTGSTDLVLKGAAVAGVELVELHNHIKEGEAMRMVSVPTITIPAGKTVSFAPGGLHIMLMGLPEGGLATDSTVTITLDFGEAGSLAVDAKVSKPAGGDHAHKHHHHH